MAHGQRKGPNLATAPAPEVRYSPDLEQFASAACWPHPWTRQSNPRQDSMITLAMSPDQTLTADPLARLAFSVHGSLGVYALLLGSGLSRAAGIPTGWHVTIDLVRRLAALKGVTNHPDWADWYRNVFGREPDYSDLVAELGSTAHDRRAILHGYIEPTDEEIRKGRKVPTKAHRAIADLVHDGFIRVILTTNFDRLLETALRERNVEPTVIDSVDVLAGSEPLAHTKCYLLKLHGDYKDARIRNTETELARYPREYEQLLDRIFDEHGLIVCGWSADWDEALKCAILRNPSRRYSFFWATRHQPGEAAQKLITHRNGHVLRISDADDFLGNLRDHVRTLARTQRQEPATVDLLVNTTKRYASRPEHRIDLHDLLAAEVERFRRSLAASAPPMDANADRVAQLVAACESKVEPLARMLGVLGRWGDGGETDDVANILITLSKGPTTQPSVVHLNGYPTVLLLWSYGTGLVMANRWRELHDLLSHAVDGDVGQPTRLVDIPARWFLEGNRNDFWKRMSGLEDRKTPASDHLFEILNTWRISFAPVASDFEGLHDTWEILFSLTYSETRVSEEPGVMPPWTHVGRNLWRAQSRHRVLDRISGELRRDLLEAGFFGGSRTRLGLVVDSYTTFIGPRG